MDGFLRVDHAILPSSPTVSSMDEVASICPLITPSPPTNDLINPLPEPSEPTFSIGEELVEKLHQVQDDEKVDADSASSSAEQVCSDLLNHRNSIYHHIAKDEETIAQGSETTQPMQLTFKNPPEDYFFMSWNWPLIRKISLWIFLSALVAMVALVIAMIWNLPKTCNPPTQWYQGNLFYEIFPSSFYSSQHKNRGDLKGITSKIDYIENLGVRAVRLNSIFKSPNYPWDFENVSNLMEIDPSLGSLEDFKVLATDLKMRNISLVLDMPISSFVNKLGGKRTISVAKNVSHEPISEFLRLKEDPDPVEVAIQFWSLNGVDGIYLKGLEHFSENVDFVSSLRSWKKALGNDKIIMVGEEFINSIPKPFLKRALNIIDLVDVKLKLEKGVLEVSKQIDSIQNGTLFSERGMPWIHWSLGNVNSNRLANILTFGNATLGATLLQMMLPGTPSIFYGDEIGLQETTDIEQTKLNANNLHPLNVNNLHQLTMMQWQNENANTLSWLGSDSFDAVFDQVGAVAKMTTLRSQSPSIYMNAIYKEGENKANAEVKYSQKDFLVIQRWYPRRKAYVVASNLGNVKISADLSTLLYTGQVIVGPRSDSSPGTISFKAVNLWPGESVVIVLD